MTVAIVDYGSGNLRSAAKAFERAAHEAGIGAEKVRVTADPAVVLGVDRVVLPGVGAFGDCMAGLSAIPGMLDALTEAVTQAAKPFLGICVGMQLLARRGIEHGTFDGLGWIDGEVRPIEPADPSLKIPHMGWNTLVTDRPGHPVMQGLQTGADVYFVHSYGMQLTDAADGIAHADYAGPIQAVVGRDNIVGTQFHPEKSQAAGLRLIGNFLRWAP